MVDLAGGLQVAGRIVEECLEGHLRPFLTPSRVKRDFVQMRQCLGMVITALSSADIDALLPVVLSLQGYEAVGQDTHDGHHFWEIEFLDPAGARHKGLAAVVERTDDLRAYGQIMDWRGYIYAQFYCVPGISLSTVDSVSKHVSSLGQQELAHVLGALAAWKYVDAFSETIVSISGMRESVRDVLSDTGLSWEEVQAIGAKWTQLAQSGCT